MAFLSSGSWKFVGGFLGIIALALVGLGVSDYFFNPERQAARNLKELERQYAEDTYGGITPEETLELFIKALEAGDIELASKYFVVGGKEEWEGNLNKIKDSDLLDDMISDLKREKYKNGISENQITFSIANDNKEVALTILMGRVPGGVWKIVDM